MDSGCTQHMTGDSHMFKSISIKGIDEYESITFGNDKKGSVLGLGKIAITQEKSLSKVLLVDNLDYNLLSVSQLCDLGYKCIFTSQEVEVVSGDGASMIFKGFRYGDLYLVDFNSREATLTTCLLSKASMGWLWHRRLGHVGMK